eukprot:2089465-Rhodomonas_salina.2
MPVKLTSLSHAASHASRRFHRPGNHCQSKRRAVIRHCPDSESGSSVGSLGGRLAVYLHRSRQVVVLGLVA